VGQPGCGRGLPQPGQLTIGEELLGYHNNNLGGSRGGSSKQIRMALLASE